MLALLRSPPLQASAEPALEESSLLVNLNGLSAYIRSSGYVHVMESDLREAILAVCEAQWIVVHEKETQSEEVPALIRLIRQQLL